MLLGFRKKKTFCPMVALSTVLGRAIERPDSKPLVNQKQRESR